MLGTGHIPGSGGNNGVGGPSNGAGVVGGVPHPANIPTAILGGSVGGGAAVSSLSAGGGGEGEGGAEELLPLVIHLTDPDQVSYIIKQRLVFEKNSKC